MYRMSRTVNNIIQVGPVDANQSARRRRMWGCMMTSQHPDTGWELAMGAAFLARNHLLLHHDMLSKPPQLDRQTVCSLAVHIRELQLTVISAE